MMSPNRKLGKVSDHVCIREPPVLEPDFWSQRLLSDVAACSAVTASQICHRMALFCTYFCCRGHPGFYIDRYRSKSFASFFRSNIQRCLLVKLLDSRVLGSTGHCCSWTAVSFSSVSNGVQVYSVLTWMNDASKCRALRTFASFVSKETVCIEPDFWSPRLISDVAACSAVTASQICRRMAPFCTLTYLCCPGHPGFYLDRYRSKSFANFFRSNIQRCLLVKLLDSRVLGSTGHCCSWTAVSFSSVSNGVQVYSALTWMNDASKCRALRTFASFVSKETVCIEPDFWSPRLIFDVAVCSAVTASQICHRLAPFCTYFCCRGHPGFYIDPYRSKSFASFFSQTFNHACLSSCLIPGYSLLPAIVAHGQPCLSLPFQMECMCIRH